MNYRKEMLRTLSPKGDLYEHALYGLVTEAAEALDTLKKVKFYGKEFDKVHALEELGDIRWYLELVAYHMKFVYNNDMTHDGYITYEDNIKKISMISSMMLQGEVRPSKYYIDSMYSLLFCAADDIGYNIKDVERANIAKLKKRYPEKWTQEKAEVRDLQTERKVLEDNLTMFAQTLQKGTPWGSVS